jgi:hypothetical protein
MLYNRNQIFPKEKYKKKLLQPHPKITTKISPVNARKPTV